MKKNVQILKEQKESYLKNKNATCEMYDKIILYYENLFSEATKTKQNKENYLNALQIQFERGMITKIDLQKSEIVLLQAKTIESNYKDLIWYYKWLRSLIV